MGKKSKAESGKRKAEGTVVLLTCEHGGNEIPAEYRKLFRGAGDVLKSHRGWDPGALQLAERFAASLNAPLFSSTVSRLLVELNRSLHHKSLFSEFTRDLPDDTKQAIVSAYYLPHRQAVEQQITAFVTGGKRVLHIGVHSFTPELNGEVRTAEIGLLYDPKRKWERSFCDAWGRAIKQVEPAWRVRKNYPYLGIGDGFTTYLRTRFTDRQYAGVELEVNQRFPLYERATWPAVQEQLATSLVAATAS